MPKTLLCWLGFCSRNGGGLICASLGSPVSLVRQRTIMNLSVTGLDRPAVLLALRVAGSPEVLEHRARELAALNPLVDVGRKQAHANGEPLELTAEASVASVAGILHTRLVTGEAPPFIGLLGQLVGLVVCPYLDPHEVVREIKRGEQLARKIAEEHSSSSSSPIAGVQLPAVLRHPGAFRARSCVIFIAANPGASNREIAAGIGIPHLGQASELLARLARGGLLRKHAGGAGRPNKWWLAPHGEQIAPLLETSDHHIDRRPRP